MEPHARGRGLRLQCNRLPRRSCQRINRRHAHNAICFRRDKAKPVAHTDPPSFAPSEAARGPGLAAYRRVAASALRAVAPRGTLAFASCSSHIREADLHDVLADAALATGRALRLRAVLGAASDHPTLPAFPEGRYLKFLLCDVE